MHLKMIELSNLPGICFYYDATTLCMLWGYLCHLLLAEPDVLKEVKQKLDLGSVKFEVLSLTSCLIKWSSTYA